MTLTATTISQDAFEEVTTSAESSPAQGLDSTTNPTPPLIEATVDMVPSGRWQKWNSKAPLRTAKKAGVVSSHVSRMLGLRDELKHRVASPVICSVPILTQDGEGIIWPNTINLIQGQTGTHKSRVAEHFASFLIAKGDFAGEALGLTLGNSIGRPYSVCYVDTERNQQEQLIQAVQKMKQRAGYDYSEHPAHFDYNSLLDVPRTDRLETLRGYLEHIRGEMLGHLVIVLDQLADCVADFNDPKESMLLTDLLNVMVNQQDVTFICVIHENPGGTKARGHLGTEMANKASTVLQLSFIKAASGAPSPVLQMKYIKRRSGSRDLTLNMQYDADKGQLVRANTATVKTALDNRKRTAHLDQIIALLGEVLTAPMPISKLKEQLAAKVGSSTKTVGFRLDELIKEKIEIPDADGVACTLASEQVGKTILYRLAPIGKA